MLKLLKVYNAALDHYSLWDFCVFIQIWIYLLLSSHKKPENKYTSFVKPKCVLLIGETRTQWQIFKVDFDYIRQIVTSTIPFYSKTYTKGVFRTQLSIYNKAFLWFLQKSSTIDVRLGSKYASVYIRASPKEVICILNIFAVKYIFSDKRMK